jgi:hypothetical protein
LLQHTAVHSAMVIPYVTILTGYLTAKFPNRSVRFISNEYASHMLLQFGIDWYRIGNVNTTKGHSVLYSLFAV